jgi:hypothetical protein
MSDMAKLKIVDNTALVTAHIQKLEPNLRDTIETLRQIILSTDTEIGEEIKWNNPTFYYTGEMQPFDPKEFKRHIVVMNLHKGRIMLVFLSGAKIQDTTGFLEGDYKDGRKITIFKDIDDVSTKKDILQNSIKKWLELVEK